LKRDDILKLGVFLALAALALTIWVGAHGTPLPGDTWITEHIQDFGRLRENAGLINGLQNWQWLFLGIGAVLVLFRKRLGAGKTPENLRREALSAFAAAVLLRFGDSLLKEIVRSPRPVATFDIHVQGFSNGFGFPSGHVYSDVLIYGVLGVMATTYLSPRMALVARVLIVALIVLCGPARVVVGAHWPSDTAGGYLWGGAALCAAVWFGRWVSQRR
jgi:membrane-associated phospholipid phosphatase